MSDNTVILKKPIMAHGDEVKTLTFREPNGEDIIACGYPLQMGTDTYIPIAGVIAKYIGRLSGIPASSVKALSAVDFNVCMGAILPFFADSASNQPPASED